MVQLQEKPAFRANGFVVLVLEILVGENQTQPIINAGTLY